MYFAILYIRHHAGIVTDEMLDAPKAPFIVVGLLEALAAATGMAAGGNFAPFESHFQLILISSISTSSLFCFVMMH